MFDYSRSNSSSSFSSNDSEEQVFQSPLILDRHTAYLMDNYANRSSYFKSSQYFQKASFGELQFLIKNPTPYSRTFFLELIARANSPLPDPTQLKLHKDLLKVSSQYKELNDIEISFNE